MFTKVNNIQDVRYPASVGRLLKISLIFSNIIEILQKFSNHYRRSFYVSNKHFLKLPTTENIVKNISFSIRPAFIPRKWGAEY